MTVSLRKTLAVAVVLATTGLLAPTPDAASATSQSPADTTQWRFRGDSVQGQTVTTTTLPDGCEVYHVVQVVGDKNLVWYGRFDENLCSGTRSTSIYGAAKPTTFKVTGNMDHVQVTATIPLDDLLSGHPTGKTLALNNVWNATSTPIRHFQRIHEQYPSYFTETIISRGMWRSASVTGSVPLVQGDLWRTATIDVLISRWE